MTKNRLESFIDAVLAIIITILVLGLAEPSSMTLSGFWNLRENFFAYTLSFFWLGAMWVNLHNGWYKVRRISTKTIWISLIMLFFASLFPYSTSLVSEHYNSHVAQGFYGIVVLAITFSNLAVYRNLVQENPDILTSQTYIVHFVKWIYFDLFIKLMGLIICIFWYPPAMIISVLITLIGIVIPEQFKTRK